MQASVLFAEPAQGEARILEDELFHLSLAVAISCNGDRVLGAERKKGLAIGEQVVAARLTHGPGDDLEHAEAGVAVVILDIVRPLAAHDRHRAHVDREAMLDVERVPRALRFVLRYAVGDLGGTPLGRSVARAGKATPHVHEEKTHGTPDRHVGAKALTESVVARIDAELARDRSIDDHDRSHRVRGGLDGVEIEGGIRERFDGCDDHRHVFGLAPGHDRVDGDPLDGRLPLPWRQDGHDVERIAIGPAQKFLHVPVRGRNDGQAVRPAALLVEAVDGRIGGIQPERLGRGAGPAHALVTARTTRSMARSAFLTTSSSRMPPSGWGMRARGRSASPRFRASSLASCSNSYVPMTTVGIPRCSSTMAPWILHDVHDPQSALPTRTKSHVVSAARISGLGAPAMPFSRFTTSVTPYFSLSRAVTASIRVPALALLLSRMPARLPSRLAKRGARPV